MSVSQKEIVGFQNERNENRKDINFIIDGIYKDTLDVFMLKKWYLNAVLYNRKHKTKGNQNCIEAIKIILGNLTPTIQ